MVVPQLNHGGAERQTAILIEHLAIHHQIRPLVCCMTSLLEPFGSRIRAVGCELVHWNRGRSYEIGRVRFLRRLFKEREVRLVHAVHYQAVAYAWMALVGRRDEVAFVPAVRSTVHEPTLRKRAFYRFVLPRCRVVIANSLTGGQWLEQFYGVPKEQVAVIPNGLDPKLLAAAVDRQAVRAKLGIPGEAPMMAFVGKTNSHKGLGLLVRTVRNVLGKLPGAHLVMMGTGLTPTWVQDNFGSQKSVHGLGIRDDVYDVLGAADCLLLTSSSEGFPNAVLEAMVLGVPPVTTKVGQCPILIDHGEDGFLFDYDDDAEASRLVLRVLEDPGLRAAMSVRGRAKMLTRYGTDAMVDATLSVYERALGHAFREAALARRN